MVMRGQEWRAWLERGRSYGKALGDLRPRHDHRFCCFCRGEDGAAPREGRGLCASDRPRPRNRPLIAFDNKSADNRAPRIYPQDAGRDAPVRVPVKPRSATFRAQRPTAAPTAPSRAQGAPRSTLALSAASPWVSQPAQRTRRSAVTRRSSLSTRCRPC